MGEFEAGAAPRYRLETYLYGEKYFRIYDLNEVGKAYRSSEGIKKMKDLYSGGSRLDYGDKKWRNYVFLNYWGWEPGDSVQILEKNRSLKVEATRYEDPAKTFAYELPRIMNPYKHSTPKPRDNTFHMFVARASSAKSPVTVRIYASDGRLKFEKTVQRPIAFDPSEKEE